MLGSHIVNYVKTTVVIKLNLSTMASMEQELGSYCTEFPWLDLNLRVKSIGLEWPV